METKIIEEQYEKTSNAVKDISLCLQEFKKIHDKISSPIVRETTKQILQDLKQEQDCFVEELAQIDFDLQVKENK